MSKAINQRRFRILALDVDGTLLDPDGAIRPRTAAAVARAAEAGIQPVLCTGRRYRRARPIAEQLVLNVPIVCNSGAMVKNPWNHQTLWRADLDLAIVVTVLDIFETHGYPAVAFTDRCPHEADFIVRRFPSGLPLFDEYVNLNHQHAEVEPEWARDNGDERHAPPPDARFHFCAVGSRVEMQAMERVVQGRLSGQVQTFVQRSPRYLGTMCEVLRHDASKWTAILDLAQLWGVDPSEICAVGDDVNDVPMIRNAGLGVAMGHAPAAVREAADLVTGDHSRDGVAMLVDDVLLAP